MKVAVCTVCTVQHNLLPSRILRRAKSSCSFQLVLTPRNAPSVFLAKGHCYYATLARLARLAPKRCRRRCPFLLVRDTLSSFRWHCRQRSPGRTSRAYHNGVSFRQFDKMHKWARCACVCAGVRPRVFGYRLACGAVRRPARGRAGRGRTPRTTPILPSTLPLPLLLRCGSRLGPAASPRLQASIAQIHIKSSFDMQIFVSSAACSFHNSTCLVYFMTLCEQNVACSASSRV